MYFSKNEKKNVFKNIIFNGLVNNYSSTPSFSFKLRQDRETSLVYQSPSQLLKVFLKKKYQGLNASTSQMDESPHRKKQGDRFLNIFKKNCKEKNLKSKSFLKLILDIALFFKICIGCATLSKNVVVSLS